MTLTRRERFRLWRAKTFLPIDTVGVLGRLAVVLLLAVALVSIAASSEAERRDDQADERERENLAGQLASQQALNDCRSGLAAEVSAATSNQLIVIGRLVVALGNRDPEGFTTHLEDLLVASERLAEASTARDEFELTQDCPP